MFRFPIMLLVLVAASPVRAAPEGVERVWSDAVPWVVVRMKGAPSPVCTALVGNQPGHGFTFIVAIAFSRTTSHLYVQLDGHAVPAPPLRATLLAGDTPLLTAPVEPMTVSPERVSWRVDLPGAVLTRTLLPALDRAGRLVVRADALALAVPTARFGVLASELSGCADTLRPGSPSTSG